SDVYTGLDRVAADLTLASTDLAAVAAGGDPGSVAALQAALTTSVADIGTLQQKTWPVFEQKVIDLDLTRCPGWNDTGAPLPPPTPSSPPPADLDPAESELARAVGFQPTQCRPADVPQQDVASLAQINCRGSGLDSDPVVLSFG